MKKIIPLILVAQFSVFQLILVGVLWLNSESSHGASLKIFIHQAQSNVVVQAFLLASTLAFIALQLLKNRWISQNDLKLKHLIILLALAEFPGILGFAAAVMDRFSMSVGLPFIMLSLFGIMSVRPVALQLFERG